LINGAEDLSDFSEYNPNDPVRIAIFRDWKWLRDLWKNEIRGDYDKSNKAWRAGTGGGPGAPENYENWETRAPEMFENYTKVGKTKSTKKYLAWVYMKDCEASPQDVLFGAAGSVPDHLRNETGSSSQPGSGRNTLGGTGRQTPDPLLQQMIQLQKEANANTASVTSQLVGAVKSLSEESKDEPLLSSFQMVKMIREELNAIAACPHTSEDVKKRRIAKLQKKLDDVYEAIV